MAINDLSLRVHHCKDEWPKKSTRDNSAAFPSAFYTALWRSFISPSPPAPFRLKNMAVQCTGSLCAEVRIYAPLTYRLLDNKTHKETLFHFYGWAALLYSTWESFQPRASVWWTLKDITHGHECILNRLHTSYSFDKHMRRVITFDWIWLDCIKCSSC